MKKQHHETPTLDKLDFISSLEENTLAQWLIAHGRNIVLGILGAFILLFAVFYIFSGNSSKAESDYYNAYQDFQVFQRKATGEREEGLQSEAFEKLQQILLRHPDLNAKYDGPIAQTLINRGNPVQAKEFATLAFARTRKDDLGFYTDFAKNTLLISEKNYTQALADSKALNQKMIENAGLAEQEPDKKAFGDALFAYNLLRIAFLEEKAGTPQAELKSWHDWKLYAGISGKPSPLKNVDNKAFFVISSIFDQGQVSLANYIEAREKKLSLQGNK